MKRIALWVAILSLAAVAPAFARARTYFGFNIGISNAPPPPAVVFDDEPDFVVVPRTRVYVVESDYDYDIFRYGGFYYVSDDGYWYCARNYRGPFHVIDARYVPRSVYYVPQRHWKHYPRHESYSYWDDDRGYGHKHGHKHGHGHGDDDD